MATLDRQITSTADLGGITPSDGDFHNFTVYDVMALGAFDDDGWNAWMRFPNITVPQGATIDRAYLLLPAQGANTPGAVESVISGIDEDDHARPSSVATWNTDHGMHTSAQVTWDFNSSIMSGTVQTPDITAIIQEIVNRAGWQSGNDIGIHIDDDGTASALVGFDEDPTLHIEYTEGGEEPGEIDLGHHDASPTFHAPTIQGTVDLAHLDASASFAAPTVAAASVDLEAFDASPTFHDPTIAAASVDLAHLDASATFHDPTLFDNSVQLGHLDASATFHDLTVSGSVTLDAFDAAPVFHDTEVAGSVTLDALDASASFHDPTVGAASVDLDPFDASATFHTLSVSGEGIGLAHLAATATFHTLTVGATTVDLEHLAATAIFHSPLVIPVIVHSPGVGKTAGVTAGARTRASESAGAAVGDGQFGITKRTSNAGVAADPAGEGGS